MKFTKMDLNQLHDVVFNALDIELQSDDEIIKYYEMLPNDIKDDFEHWGVGDTPTRDAAYLWFINNCQKQIKDSVEEQSDIKATLIFSTRQTAEDFLIAWSRKTLRGHSIGSGKTNVKVVVYNVTDEDKEWIDAYVSELNNGLS